VADKHKAGTLPIPKLKLSSGEDESKKYFFLSNFSKISAAHPQRVSIENRRVFLN